MKLTIDEFVGKIDAFIVSDIIPGAKSMQTKFAVGFARPIISTLARQKLGEMCAAHLFGPDEGIVDTTVLKTCMLSGFDAGGASGAPSYMGLRLERSDVDRFFAGIEG